MQNSVAWNVLTWVITINKQYEMNPSKNTLDLNVHQPRRTQHNVHYPPIAFEIELFITVQLFVSLYGLPPKAQTA